MNKFLRMASLGATVAALTLTAAPAIAAPVSASTSANATARIIKPLTIEKQTDLDFGDITVWGTGTATMSATGAINCPGGGTTLVCAASGTPAEFTVKGTNNQVVTVSMPAAVSLTTVGSTDTLSLALTNPGTLTLSNSGQTGTALKFGGSMTIPQDTDDGQYTGTFSVTVNY